MHKQGHLQFANKSTTTDVTSMQVFCLWCCHYNRAIV